MDRGRVRGPNGEDFLYRRPSTLSQPGFPPRAVGNQENIFAGVPLTARKMSVSLTAISYSGS